MRRPHKTCIIDTLLFASYARFIVELSSLKVACQRPVHKLYSDFKKMFSPFIYMVPSVLRNVNPSSFNPRLVSIGPLHREDEDVKAFEGQKVSYIIDLMKDSDSQKILESCNEKAHKLMNEIKASYILPKTFTDDEINAEMMVTDALFILGFIKKHWKTASASDQESSSGYWESSSGKRFQVQTIMNDLLLLENQIPLFFLVEMFQCTRSIFTPGLSLLDLIRPLLRAHNLFHKADLKVDNISMGNTDHILSLLHQCYAPPNNFEKRVKTNRIPSVADLDMAGVSFKPNNNNNNNLPSENPTIGDGDRSDLGSGGGESDNNNHLLSENPTIGESEDKTWVMGIEVKQYRFWRFFWKKYTLTMPVLVVDDSTEFLIRNLIAYEQFFETPKYVSSYASAMDKLINTADDVAKLIHSGVLNNFMGSNEEAANMINNLCKNVICGDSYYEEEWVKLNEYCKRFWTKQRAWFRRTYCIHPWTFITFIAGIILFVLQLIQTIRSFYND